MTTLFILIFYKQKLEMEYLESVNIPSVLTHAVYNFTNRKTQQAHG